jgi:hypothetical protein
MWCHGLDKLNNFLFYLNSSSDHILFTMEIKNSKFLHFLDILVNKMAESSLSHQVYREGSHTERYLHANSHHHPLQNETVQKAPATGVV